MTVWLSNLCQKAVHFRPEPSTRLEGPSTFPRLLPVIPLDRPLWTQSLKATRWYQWAYFQSIAVISQLSNIPLKKNYQINGSIGLQNGTNDTNTSLISRATLIARPQQEPRPMSSKLYKKIAQFRRQMANGSKWPFLWPYLTSFDLSHHGLDQKVPELAIFLFTCHTCEILTSIIDGQCQSAT